MSYEDERYVAECRVCCWSASGTDDYRLELKADTHSIENGHKTRVLTEKDWESM